MEGKDFGFIASEVFKGDWSKYQRSAALVFEKSIIRIMCLFNIANLLHQIPILKFQNPNKSKIRNSNDQKFGICDLVIEICLWFSAWDLELVYFAWF